MFYTFNLLKIINHQNMLRKNISRAAALILVIFVINTAALQAQDQKSNQTFEFTNLFNSGDLDDGCYRIPALITASNGDVIAAIDERVENCGDLRSNRDINIVIRRSSDNGETWSEIETVIDYPFGESASDPSMILDRETSTLWMFFNYMDLENEKDIYYLKAVSSKDNGKTWSKPVDITSQITKPEWHDDFKFITSGRGIQTTDGTMLHTLVNLDEGVFLFGSKDHGENWFLLDSPINPADESKVIELSDGSLMVNSRVANIGMRYIHTSSDHGKRWTSKPDSTLIDPGSNASLLRHTTKEHPTILLFSNSKHPDERKNMTIRSSFDEGKTWTEGTTIYPGSAAYSSMTILENGNIGLFFEKDHYSENVFVTVPLHSLMSDQ
jgi:sialidase-1